MLRNSKSKQIDTPTSRIALYEMKQLNKVHEYGTTAAIAKACGISKSQVRRAKREGQI